MQRLRSPRPNRRGKYETHYVPQRRVAPLLARGWTRVDAESEPTPHTDTTPPQRQQVDLSGPWFAKRAEVRDLLGLSRVPASKEAAADQLRAAGYEVTGA